MIQQSTSPERRPFLSAPSPKRYFAAGAAEEARLRIVRAIARNEGPAILVGGAGTGKSLLLAVLAEQFAPRVAVVTLMGAQLCTRRALLQMILSELGLPYRGMDEGELRLSILQHLRGGDGPARRLLLLVDEAEALPTRLLEELRVLTNVAAEGMPLVSLVLGGGPILEERFADPQLEKFSQRIAARCYLAPLGREETFQYVRSQVSAAGMKPERLFTADALEAIHAATGGVPRVINQLGDQLVWMAEETGCAPLDATLVQQAWSDLQQLPAPWNIAGGDAMGSAGVMGVGVVEFGELDGESLDLDVALTDEDDVDDELPASIPIDSGRAARRLLAAESFDATLDDADLLLESFDHFDQFGALELRAADPEPIEEPEPEPSAAVNPFDEPFDEEEIVLDPYAAFESELLRTAPQVINRLDRAFACELHRCVQRAVAKPAVAVPPATPNSKGALSAATRCDDPWSQFEHLPVVDRSDMERPMRLHSTAEVQTVAAQPAGELLIVEEDERASAAIVQGQQFRRLFSSLESTANRSLLG